MLQQNITINSTLSIYFTICRIRNDYEGEGFKMMSIRWRKDGTLLCGAKSEAFDDDCYIDDRLHYQLSVILKVIKPDVDERQNGIWRWT